MEAKKVERINFLARKAKTPEGLTIEEKEEQAALRREYIDAYKRNLKAQLDNIVIQEPDSTRHHLPRKKGGKTL
jgi:uncharacterized protein YnzC (UPF0291/DUF896 family)